ncbi:hypothetical protein [Archangium sp.]|uniref:hypothetical protein n=1 Tax=Archangium sp. TaxID=1872627 RepID=UPI00286D127F|nr:hypothetical protein [Archangium sp.]
MKTHASKVLLVSGLVLLHSAACGPIEGDTPASPDVEPGHQTQALSDANGLAFNGLAVNGLAFNGLAMNGLAVNGLSTQAFSSWFQKDAALHAQVMKYLVHCAAPRGVTRGYTNAQENKTYTWAGGMGLAPDWTSGKPATETEQQLVSACLAAHANKHGVSVSISVLGRTARGWNIPLGPDELSLYPKREACFFGNLFSGEGLYVANDGTTLGSSQSSPRACGLLGENKKVREQCAPLVFVGSCEELCTQDPTDNFYVSCRYNGKTWRPIVTRLRDQDLYSCGDHRCQFTERCGTGESYDSCQEDCGRCR